MKRLLLIFVALAILVGAALFWLNGGFGTKSEESLEVSLEHVKADQLLQKPAVEKSPEPASETQSKPQSSTPHTATAPEPTRAPTLEKILDQGTLAVEARDTRFAEEAYILKQLTDGTYQLVSQGKLKFKIWLVDSELRYTQAISWGSDLRPVSFALEMKGPAGIGNREVQAEITGSRVHIRSDGKETERPAPNEPFLLLAMFSSYSALPQWIAKAHAADAFTAPVFTLRTAGEKTSREAGASPASQVTLKKIGTVQLQDKKDMNKRLTVQSYSLQTTNFNSVIYVDGARFVGLLSEPSDKTSDRRFFMYREDLFPGGFAIVPKSP